MPILEVKSAIAVPLLAVGVITVLFMFDLMGRSKRKIDPKVLRRGHLLFGYIFIVLLAILAYLGMKYVAVVGDRMSTRAVFHGVLALGLISVLLVKVLIVRFYRELMRFVPTLGIVTFILAFVVFFTSAGYFFLREAHGHAGGEVGVAEPLKPPAAADIEGDPAGGRIVFARDCAACHAADSQERRIGPGLKGVLAKQTLPESGRPATVANIRSQIVDPEGAMPAFTSYTDREMADLLAYIKTL